MTKDDHVVLVADMQSESELLERQILMPRLPSEKQQLIERLRALKDKIAEIAERPPFSAAAA